jgi:hypothetical protein
MKFTIPHENGVKTYSMTIWDAESNAPLCEFIDGVFVTEDETIIGKLNDLGYVGEEVGDDVPESKEEIVSPEKLLREKAKELGIKSYHLKSVETLEKEIAEHKGA